MESDRVVRGSVGSIDVDLSWPDKALWPNGGHSHYMVVSRARRKAREEAHWSTKIAKPLNWHWNGQPIAIHIVAHPKTAHSVDAQNLIAGLKAQFDGIASALNVDDKHFQAPTVQWGEPIKGGKVVVCIGGGE